jgi:hypothetical protein
VRALKQRPFACRYTWGVFYDGTREELLAAGVVHQGEFPGDPGRAKWAYTIDERRKIQRVQHSARRFQVMVADELALEQARTDAPLQAFLASCRRLYGTSS